MATAQVALTSAAGVVALLEEPAPALKAHALKQLNVLVDVHWSEVSACVTELYVRTPRQLQRAAMAQIFAAARSRAGAPSSRHVR